MNRQKADQLTDFERRVLGKMQIGRAYSRGGSEYANLGEALGSDAKNISNSRLNALIDMGYLVGVHPYYFYEGSAPHYEAYIKVKEPDNGLTADEVMALCNQCKGNFRILHVWRADRSAYVTVRCRNSPGFVSFYTLHNNSCGVTCLLDTTVPV